jgi:hypothetical protein
MMAQVTTVAREPREGIFLWLANYLSDAGVFLKGIRVDYLALDVDYLDHFSEMVELQRLSSGLIINV